MPSRRPLPRPAAPGPGRWYGLSPPHGTSCPWAPSAQSGRPYAASRLCGISLESTSPPKPPAGNASAESASISPFRGVVLRNRRRDRNVIQPAVPAAPDPVRDIMWVIFDHLRPSGHIMPDHVGDRGAARLDLGVSRSPTYQPIEYERRRRRGVHVGQVKAVLICESSSMPVLKKAPAEPCNARAHRSPSGRRAALLPSDALYRCFKERSTSRGAWCRGGCTLPFLHSRHERCTPG